MLRVATFVLLTGLPLAALANDCDFTAERKLDFDAKGLSSFKLDTGAGDLTVEGVPGLARVEVRGRACASEEKALSSIQLMQQREGDIASVGTKIPDEGFSWSLFSSHYAYMDVHVRMPSSPDARVTFMAEIENLNIDIAPPAAKVVINARTGSVVMNQAVTLAACAVAHGNLSVTINSTPVVSQPSPFSTGGQTVVAQKSDISITQQGGSLVQMSAGNRLADVVKALNALGATPQDLLAILQAMKSAGALNAELEVI